METFKKILALATDRGRLALVNKSQDGGELPSMTVRTFQELDNAFAIIDAAADAGEEIFAELIAYNLRISVFLGFEQHCISKAVLTLKNDIVLAKYESDAWTYTSLFTGAARTPSGSDDILCCRCIVYSAARE